MDQTAMLRGKTALVTGGGSGIGRAIALAFGAAGAKVAVCGRRLEPCEETCVQIRELGAEALCVRCDVSDAADVERLVGEVTSRFSHIDILVNNAAIAGAGKPFLEISVEEWGRTLAVNLTGVMLCTQAVARHMVGAGGGKIINVASVLSYKVASHSSDYCASKGGVLQLTRAMALELARHKIQVNAICPGYFHTDFAPDLPATEADAIAWAKKKRIPGGRLGDPSEIGPLAVFLASPASDYVIGSSFVVDGGVMLT